MLATSGKQGDEFFVEKDGIFFSRKGVLHRDGEFDQRGFDILLNMQREHFWYAGRHKFILQELLKISGRERISGNAIKAIDLGGGCGGWVDFLHKSPAVTFEELALGDSSRVALSLSRGIVAPSVRLYETDLLDLPWNGRWDLIFLLDVIEHIPNDLEVMRQCNKALASNGMIVVTAPALKAFWSYNDVISSHCRRYSRNDFKLLADHTGLELVDVRYFMFFLSPLFWLSRLFSPNIGDMTDEAVQKLIEKSHRIPSPPLNAFLKSIFSLEAFTGINFDFPWGTSIVGVFRKKQLHCNCQIDYVLQDA